MFPAEQSCICNAATGGFGGIERSENTNLSCAGRERGDDRRGGTQDVEDDHRAIEEMMFLQVGWKLDDVDSHRAMVCAFLATDGRGPKKSLRI